MRNRNQAATLYRWLSVPVTLAAIWLAHITNTPNPMMILVIPVVFFAYSDGYIGGALSALAAVGYALYFFSNPERLFTYDSLNAQKVLTIVVAVGVIVLLVGHLRSRGEKQTANAARLTEDFLHILSGMDVQLLVTDPHEDTVLFANDKMNTGYDIDYNPVGKPCWRVYHGVESRCSFCPKGELLDNPGEPIE